MALRPADGIYIEWVDQEAVALDSESQKLHYLNPSAALVLALIQEHGFESAIEELKKRFSAEPNLKEELVGLVWNMAAKGLLVDD